MCRKAWIEAAQRVLAGDTAGIRCPVRDDAEVRVEWLPALGGGGEFHLACPECGAENYILVQARPGTDEASPLEPGVT